MIKSAYIHSAGHFKNKNTFLRLSAKCFWKTMIIDITQYIKKCKTCNPIKINENDDIMIDGFHDNLDVEKNVSIQTLKKTQTKHVNHKGYINLKF